MSEPAAGIAEMVRVTRPGGTVAVCVWDHADGPLSLFWRAVAALHDDGPVAGEAPAPGRRAGDLGALLPEPPFEVQGVANAARGTCR